ncbi:PAS domain-containing protein, partial [Durusdinium trenchii]
MAAIGFAAASLALLAVATWPASRSRIADQLGDAGIVYLFEGRRLIDATARARRLLPKRLPDGDDWTGFVMTFAPRFEELEDQLATLPERAVVQIEESGGEPTGLVLAGGWKDGLVRLSLEEREDAGDLPETVERYALSAMQAELSTLRSVAERAPSLIWRQRADGTVIWANSAYMNRASQEASEGAMMSWPPPVLFPDVPQLADDSDYDETKPRRVTITERATGIDHWFELSTVSENEDLLCFAEPIDELVNAETSLSNFLQTLTKTFAHLTVGLAVFDRKRQLALFNPALVDLSSLPSEFLSKRPTLRAFLDALRDNQRVPEPKDYKSLYETYMPDLTTIAWMAAIGFAAASLALLAVATWPASRSRIADQLGDAGIVYLFEGRRLIDATARARRLLPKRLPDGDDWTGFVMTFAPRFEELEDQLATLPERAVVQIEESGGEPTGLVLAGGWKDGLVRLSLEEREDAGDLPETVERYALSAMQAELSTLRSVAERAPSLIWRQRADGTVIWANSAYMNRASQEASEGAMMSWPPPVLFPDVPQLADDSDYDETKPRRVTITERATGIDHWFELSTVSENEDLLCFAEPIDELVNAETSLSNFLQTLTKTFAHLTVGLAVFDRKRQLALFNPALVDLSSLPSEFLSKRPTLRAFLDALRDNQRVPEPKDYKS